MSDLSPSEALEPLENSPTTHAHVANTEDLTPEDWETLMDEETNEETKSGKDDVNMESSQENDFIFANRLQAEEDLLEKSIIPTTEPYQETPLEAIEIETDLNENSQDMAIEQTRNDETEGTTSLRNAEFIPQAPASASVHPTETKESPTITKHMLQRLLQKKVIANEKQKNLPKGMAEPYKNFEEILKAFSECDKASIGLFNDLVYIPPHLFEKYLVPTSHALCKVNTLADTLFPASDAAIIKTLFAEATIMGANTQNGESSDAAIGITEQPIKNPTTAINDFSDVMKSKEASLNKYVNQLRNAASLPDEDAIIAMTDEELLQKNIKLDQLFTSFEAQIARDYRAFQKTRSDNILLASSNYDQLMKIYKLTDDYAQVQNEKLELSNKVDKLDITGKVATIQKHLDQLQATLSDKLTGLSQLARPNDESSLKETNTRLKQALRTAVRTNEKIIQQYDTLNLHYSFMPKAFHDMIATMQQEKDPIYLNQRHDPHHIEADPKYENGVDFLFLPWTTTQGEDRKYLQRTACLSYNDILDTQMETNLEQIRSLNDTHANPNEHPQSPSAQFLRSESECGSSTTVETQSVNGKRAVQDTIPHNAKLPRYEKQIVATAIPSISPTYPVITHKHTPTAKGNRDTRPFPYYVESIEVVIYTMRTLHYDALCPYKVMEPTPITEAECHSPTEDFLNERVAPEQALNETTKHTYKIALSLFNKVHKSKEQYCYEMAGKYNTYTSKYRDVKGEEINPTNFKQINKTLDWQLIDKFGNYYKVLRARPTPKHKTTNLVNFEYLPNNVYSYEETRSMLYQHSAITVKANRYWDDRFVRELPKPIFYSLNDYCPGMPVHLKTECEAMGLHPFRTTELILVEGKSGTIPPVYDTRKTVENLVNNNTLIDDNIHTVEMYIDACLSPAIDKYWNLDKTWPFELPRVLIRLHAVRLKDLRVVLQGYTKGYTQATVKAYRDENSASSSARSHPQNSEQFRPRPSNSGLGGSSR